MSPRVCHYSAIDCIISFHRSVYFVLFRVERTGCSRYEMTPSYIILSVLYSNLALTSMITPCRVRAAAAAGAGAAGMSLSLIYNQRCLAVVIALFAIDCSAT